MENDLRERLAEIDEDILVANGLDDAIIGYVESNGNLVALYNRDKCIEVLMENNEWDWETAEEFFEFNVAGAYVGEHTPMFATIF